MSTTYKGVDWGRAITNISKEGIRFGIIPQNDLDMDFADRIWREGKDLGFEDYKENAKDQLHVALEDYYVGVNEDTLVSLAADLEGALKDYFHKGPKLCLIVDDIVDEIKDLLGNTDPDKILKKAFEVIADDLSDGYANSAPDTMLWEEEGYQLKTDDCGDLWVLKSPYFTYAQFCSPCAPGACYLINPLEAPDPDNKCYCLHHEWFEKEQAPYPVYSIQSGNQVFREKSSVPCPNCNGTGRDTLERIARIRNCLIADIVIGELNVKGFKAGTFECFRCAGNGSTVETIFMEKTLPLETKPQ